MTPLPYPLRDAADGGESIAAIPARQQRSFSLRRPGATHCRRQHEAAFVEKNDVCVAFSSGFENFGKRIALPLGDGFFIPFTRPPTRLLRRPLQPRP